MPLLPSREKIILLLDRLDNETADDLESEMLDFKPWLSDIKDNLQVAFETAACFANYEGGVVVFGVKDRTKGRDKAINGCSRYDLDVWRRGIYDSTRPHLTVEIEEIEVPEGTLLTVRVPKGPTPPYGTASGLFKVRVGKNCMPLDPDTFQRRQVSAGAIDWSAQPAEDIHIEDLDPLEIARLRNVIRSNRTESPLLDLSDEELFEAIGAVRAGKVTRAGFLLLGRADLLSSYLPHHEVIYLHTVSPIDLDGRLDLKTPLLFILERLAEVINVRNPFQTLKTGLYHTNIPDYPEEVFREAILNALIHRDYLEGGSVYVRHNDREMVISSPGGFIGGITPRNILHHEPRARNRLLAEMFQKIGLVERAGIGRRRIFIPSLAYGKRPPQYESDEHTVVLTLFNGYFDEALASFVASEGREGRDFDLVDLLLLSYLQEHPEIDVPTAAGVTQLAEVRARDLLDRLSQAPNAWLERHGRTYRLSPFASARLLSRAAYTRARGLDKARWPELIRSYVEQHGSINNAECRELLGLGSSASAQVKASRLLSKLSGPGGFLVSTGKGKSTQYIMLNVKKNT